MSSQSIIVPQISSFPGHEGAARLMLRWLVQKNMVEAQLSTCGLTGNRMGYAIAEGARQVVEQPEALPFGQPVNGLEIITQRCIFMPEAGFREEAGCPECQKEVGPVLFESLDDWYPGHTDNFICPECGHEDDINGFIFLQPCGFSDLGFIFNGWGAATLKPSFVQAFAERLDCKVRLVEVETL